MWSFNCSPETDSEIERKQLKELKITLWKLYTSKTNNENHLLALMSFISNIQYLSWNKRNLTLRKTTLKFQTSRPNFSANQHKSITNPPRRASAQFFSCGLSWSSTGYIGPLWQFFWLLLWRPWHSHCHEVTSRHVTSVTHGGSLCRGVGVAPLTFHRGKGKCCEIGLEKASIDGVRMLASFGG